MAQPLLLQAVVWNASCALEGSIALSWFICYVYSYMEDVRSVDVESRSWITLGLTPANLQTSLDNTTDALVHVTNPSSVTSRILCSNVNMSCLFTTLGQESRRRDRKAQMVATYIDTSDMATKPTIAIVGSGWGGFTLAHALSLMRYNVAVISPSRTIQYTPLLASAAAGMCRSP